MYFSSKSNVDVKKNWFLVLDENVRQFCCKPRKPPGKTVFYLRLLLRRHFVSKIKKSFLILYYKPNKDYKSNFPFISLLI